MMKIILKDEIHNNEYQFSFNVKGISAVELTLSQFEEQGKKYIVCEPSLYRQSGKVGPLVRGGIDED